MSFDAATAYIKKYYTDKATSIRDNKPIKWFTSDATAYDTLLTNTFSRTDENTKWYKEQNSGNVVSYEKLYRYRLKVHFLAGVTRDLRMQYVGGKEDKREKTLSDFFRYEWARVSYLANIILTRFNSLFKDL